MVFRLTIIFFFGLNILFSNSFTNWGIIKDINLKKDRNFILLSIQSTNEERITSERVRGEFKIYCDGNSLKLVINWGEFANLGIGNVYYYTNNYGLWEQDWEMSNDGTTSYAPDPLLLLMQLLTTDSLAIGIRPKYSNDIRYYFNISGLSDVIKANQNIFSDYTAIVKDVYNNKTILKDKYFIRSMLGERIAREIDLRSLKKELFGNDRFFFNPIWFESKLTLSHLADSDGPKIIFYNRWLKKKGTLFTDKDVRVTNIFTKNPKIISYENIMSIEIKGNTITGYRMHINDKYITRFHKTERDRVEQLKTFIINRSPNYNSG